MHAIFRALPLVALATSIASVSCGIERSPRSALQDARDDAASGDSDAVGRWLLAELTAPGGTPKGAMDARAKLAVEKGGLDAKLAAALDDDVHGRGVRAFDEWISVVRAAHEVPSARARLVAIVAVESLAELAPLVPREHRLSAIVGLRSLLVAAGGGVGLGWRAASRLARLVIAAEAWAKPQTWSDVERPKAIGCSTAMRLAGPFEPAPGDRDDSALEGERPGPWPAVFEGRPNALVRPKIASATRTGCSFSVDGKDRFEGGVYLAESFFVADRTADVVLVPNDVTRVAIDDVVVHRRDRTAWGGPLLDGVVVRLQPGRHRVVWRASEATASLEIRGADGATLQYVYDADATPAYGTPIRPEPLADPHPALAASRGEAIDSVEQLLTARAALDSGAPDVAAVVLDDVLGAEPPSLDRPGPMLEVAAQAALRDPIWPSARATARAKILFDKAAELDAGLWLAPLVAIGLQGEGTQPAEKTKKLAALTARGSERPNASLALIDLYHDLGWTLEHDALVADLAARFPDDPSVLRERLAVLDEHGPIADADALAKHLADDEPDRPVLAERLLARHDWEGAADAYESFLAAHPDQKDVRLRLDELKSGLASIDDASKVLADRIAESKASALDEADWNLAHGAKHPFETAINHAIVEHGTRPTAVLHALELLQQTVDFAPFRLDARKVIAEHDKTHQGKSAGAAERILDYGAMWIRSDGTSSFLEHEIVRVNSREAIEELSRVKPTSGKALHLRVLKKDGRELEPQREAGKPDLTFPDLDVGDVIETEVISSGQAPSTAYLAPRWFFAEPKIAYARSEYLVIVPKGREVIVEQRAGAPKPTVTTDGPFDVRRWRVDDAPPAPDESDHPASPEEFLPNVTFGWGMKIEEALARAATALEETTPVDPRIVQRAKGIVTGVPAGQSLARAQKIYQWVTHNVQKGNESDGRRVVIGGAGDTAAAFRVLVRALGIATDVTIAHDRLAPPPASPLSAGEGYRHTLLSITTEQGPRFLSFGGRYLPFGYVPPSARGEEAIILAPGAPRTRMPSEGIVDGLRVEGTLDLQPNGDASGTLTLNFQGIVGASVREGIDQLTDGELQAAIESRVLAAELPGVRLRSITVLGRDDLEQPLSLRCELEVPSFARSVGGGALALFAPFQRRLSGLVPRATRATPLLLEDAELREVKIDVRLASGAKLMRSPVRGAQSFGPHRVAADDAIEGSVLHFRRRVDVHPARVEPAQYPAFVSFCRAADALASEETLVSP